MSILNFITQDATLSMPITTYEALLQKAAADERARIIQLLTDLNAIRRDALGHLVAFNTDGIEVVYLTGLERKNA